MLQIKKSILFCITSLVLVFSNYATADNQAIPRDILSQLGLPEDKIDIGIAALTFAKEFYPNLDVPAYSKQIDLLVDRAKLLANGTQDPERRIRILNSVLRDAGYHYDRSPFARSRPEYYFLNGTLDTKQGICYTMPLLYIAVAQRLGYPIYPVSAPDHLFVRYADPSFKAQNIEVTSGGKYFTNEDYIQSFSISQAGLANGSYLRTMSYKEFLGYMLDANAFMLSRSGNGQKAINYTELAIQLNPKFADNYDSLRIAYKAKSEVYKGEAAQEYRNKSEQYALKAKELGYVDPMTIERGREIRGK